MNDQREVVEYRRDRLARLLELLEKLIYHFMFGPSYETGCPAFEVGVALARSSSEACW